MKNKNNNEFICIHKDFWNVLSCLDDRMLIIDYLMKNRSGNFAIGTQNQIAHDTGLSINRVGNFIRLLEEKKVIKRQGNGVYKLISSVFNITN